MGNCFQCYPLFSKNNNITSISPSNNPQVVIDTEIIQNNNSNTHIIKLNTQKKQNTLNHGTTLEKNEPSEENAIDIIPKKENPKSKNNKNLLSLNTNKIINKRPGTVNTENTSLSNKKYNKLQSFTRQLSTESFLRAKTKGDKIIDLIPKHLGPKQISWDEGGFKKFLENKNAYSNSGNSNSLRSNI